MATAIATVWPIRTAIWRVGRVEMLTPRPDESLRFFTEVFGMSEVARQGQSVYLRAFGDYEVATLKLTESRQAGLAHTTWRASARPRSVGAAGGGDQGERARARLDRGRSGAWPGLSVGRSRWSCDEHLRGRALRRARTRAPGAENQPRRYPNRGAWVRRLDHVDCSPTT